MNQAYNPTIGLALRLAAFFFYFFGLYEVFGPDPMAKGLIMVIV